ncbi:MAG: ParB/RepB/Spo0J family partition protein [Symbiobacteriaceae bacterium]|nr:ParB/RepB/Spo0J family partition protein [Symbiobacteriaceae bacterium]
MSVYLDDLMPWEDRPFQPYSSKKLQELAASIRDKGLANPILVRTLPDNKYQILAGHNRVEACRLLGFSAILARVLHGIDDETAAALVAETNLHQRERILPSERAKAYRLLRSSKTSSDMSTDALEGTAQMSAVSRAQVERYWRLNYLIPELLQLVDEEKLSLLGGVALSYLQLSNQEYIATLVAVSSGLSLSVAQGEELKRLAKNGELILTEEQIAAVLLAASSEHPSAAEPFSSKSLLGEGSRSPNFGEEDTNGYEFLALIRSLMQSGVITSNEGTEMAYYIGREIAKAEQEAVRIFLQSKGKDTKVIEDILFRHGT